MAENQTKTLDFEALQREAEDANQALAEQEQDPFEGDCVSVETTKQINLAQFQEEISEQAGREVSIALGGLGLGEIASKGKPGVVYASPKSIGERALREAYERHHADDSLLEQPKQQTSTVTLDLSDEAEKALEKAHDGKTLTTAELTSLVTALVAGLR